MSHRSLKYALVPLLLLGATARFSAMPRAMLPGDGEAPDTARQAQPAGAVPQLRALAAPDAGAGLRADGDSSTLRRGPVSAAYGTRPDRPGPNPDTLQGLRRDSLPGDSLRSDTASRPFLDAPISGKNTDSLLYDVKGKLLHIFRKGDVDYGQMNMKADYMRIDMATKEVYAHGVNDSVDGKWTPTRPEFTEGEETFTMDTITYNMGSKKAKIKNVATQQGEGYLIGDHVKKMTDNSINIRDGRFTTCDHTDHPHFYIAMTRAKVIPGKKVVTGPAYLVLEDVPIYFLAVPEGFFPMNNGPQSGFIMPTYGEDSRRGFFLRDAGYYFAFNDYVDLSVKAGIYTLGSWEASAATRYIKRYKYTGSVVANYSKTRYGEKGEADYTNLGSFRLQWTHSQDAKFRPGSTFAASVNFTTSGYTRYGTDNNLNDILATQTNSSISYSKNWLGTPFSFSTNLSISQNSQSKTISMTFPNAVFNVARIYPFKRRERIGKERWYEKLSFTYTGKLTNTVQTDESDFFSKETLKNMRNGMEHSIPVQMQFNLLNYINVTPNFQYTERWFFKKQMQQWNPETRQVETLDPEYGFYRLYNYQTSVSAATKIYGLYNFKRKTSKIQAIRHVITPTVSFSYAPDFGKQKYGYYKTVQTDTLGHFRVYSPFSGNAYGVPSSGASMSMSFTLEQNLEMKVLSKRDTSGIKKIKLIDNFSISGSYNFLADSMGLSNIRLSLRSSILGNMGIQLSATLDPYVVTPEGRRINKLMLSRGKLGRIVQTGWSFGYTFQSRARKEDAVDNDITSQPIDPAYANPFFDPYGVMDPILRRRYMAGSYYDFSMPWNLSFNYTVSYSVNYLNNGTTGYRKNVTQSIGFNGSVNLTPKWGLTVQGGFDLQTRKLTTSSISLARDLHCWQMGFSWIPFGFHKSWSFNIGVKASMLQDLKYDKSQTMYDNMF